MINCPQCGNQFDEKTGRRPKKFCSDDCKVKFWNGQKKVAAIEKAMKNPEPYQNTQTWVDVNLNVVENPVSQESVKVMFYVPEGKDAIPKQPPKVALYATNDKKNGQIPPMPTRRKGEDAFDFAARKNDWKRLYS